MSYNLPPQLEGLRGFLPDLVAVAEEKVPYAFVLVTRSAGQTVAKSPTDERTNPVPPQPGIRISVWDGATFHSVATSRIEDRDYLLRLTRELAGSLTVKPGPMPDPGDPDSVGFRIQPQEKYLPFFVATVPFLSVVPDVFSYEPSPRTQKNRPVFGVFHK